MVAIIDDAEIAECVRLVEKIAKVPEDEYVHEVKYRDVRRALGPLIWRAMERDGHDAKKEIAGKAHRRALNRERQRNEAYAKAASERAVLRKERQKRLEELAAANSQYSPEAAAIMVPDGYVSGELHEKESEVVERYAACYCCRTRFNENHFFYGSALCPSCALLNWTKRNQTTNASGLTALVTGGRIKIGHCVALKLLRAGARVFVTSRFPTDALERFRQATDYTAWQDRLQVIGLDFRNLGAVAALAKYIEANCQQLDILINNACQTVRRPRAAYAHLIQKEERAHLLDNNNVNTESQDLIMMSQSKTQSIMPIHLPQDLATTEELSRLFPTHCIDAAGQQLDAREFNSWKMTLADVPIAEAAECFAVNALAPLTLTSQLKPAMLKNRSPDKPRFIIQVSAMEAKFNRIKTIFHPHTNAAKSALNQIVRTSAADYATDFIFMNAVDTGWVNDERPLPQASRIHQESGFQTPIDELDAAARILDPIFSVLNGSKEPYSGFFLKDYEPTDW